MATATPTASLRVLRADADPRRLIPCMLIVVFFSLLIIDVSHMAANGSGMPAVVPLVMTPHALAVFPGKAPLALLGLLGDPPASFASVDCRRLRRLRARAVTLVGRFAWKRRCV